MIVNFVVHFSVKRNFDCGNSSRTLGFKILKMAKVLFPLEFLLFALQLYFILSKNPFKIYSEQFLLFIFSQHTDIVILIPNNWACDFVKLILDTKPQSLESFIITWTHMTLLLMLYFVASPNWSL